MEKARVSGQRRTMTFCPIENARSCKTLNVPTYEYGRDVWRDRQLRNEYAQSTCDHGLGVTAYWDLKEGEDRPRYQVYDLSSKEFTKTRHVVSGVRSGLRLHTVRT